MNDPNLRKRRPHGHEDPPPVTAPPDPSFSVSIAENPVKPFTEQELHILEQASQILKCPISQLLVLDRNPTPQLQPVSHTSYTHTSKRPRLSADIASPMSYQEKSSTAGQGPSNHSFPLVAEGVRLTQYFTNFSICPPCTTCESQDYSAIPSYSYAQSRPFLDDKDVAPRLVSATMPPDQPNVFPYHTPHASTPIIHNYHILQPSRPMTVQPTSNEGMVYPQTESSHRPSDPSDAQSGSSSDNHVTGPQSYGTLTVENPKEARRRYSHVLSPDMRMPAQTRNLDIVQSNQRPPPARRGPFKSNADREKTAETRRIGSCIRCRMQRIRCETDPEDKFGPCVTCQKVSNVKIWRMPCLRYKITDVKLFKPGQVKGHEWTRRWVEGIAGDISQWASLDTKIVEVTEGYTDQPVGLRVRQFIPQEGDALERTWVYEGVRRKVSIPAYAIVNLDEAKAAYTNYINQGIFDCCKNVLSGKEKLLLATYIAAIKAASNPLLDVKERNLLKKALQLWMAVRLTTKSTIIVGDETLGMSSDIMDETSPLRGCIPLPPVMGAQIELVLIHQIQSSLRREMLENLQTMTQANKHQTWFTTYLVTFILLHNVALLCQHDASYARKHGFKSRFAREDMVGEYQVGANILLAYFHYCNKSIYPFSADCKDQDMATLAQLDESKTLFIRYTRGAVDKQRKHWQKVRESNDYENDFYFISQLYEENWVPQPTI